MKRPTRQLGEWCGQSGLLLEDGCATNESNMRRLNRKRQTKRLQKSAKLRPAECLSPAMRIFLSGLTRRG